METVEIIEAVLGGVALLILFVSMAIATTKGIEEERKKYNETKEYRNKVIEALNNIADKIK